MAYAQHQGLLQSQTQPLVVSGTDSLTSMTQVLGVSQQTFPFEPDQLKAVETMTLQRLMEGKSQYYGFTVTSMMQSANPVLLRVFPTKRTNALKHIEEFYDFPKEFAVETSAGAPPGYVKVAKSSRETTLSMYNLGATTTVQELRTSEGQFIWLGKLITVAIGFIEIAEMLVIQALLTTPSFYAQYYVKTGLHEIDLARAGRMKEIFFDILHRHDNGMAELLNAVRQDMSSRNIVPTHVIISEGMRGLIANSPLYTEYWRNGPGAAQNAIKLADSIGNTFDGIEIITVRPVDYREKRLHINLLERSAQIGQHWRIDHFHEGCDLSKWCSNWMSITVFSMETDNWSSIGLAESIDNSGRFHAGDGRLAEHHYTLAEHWRNMLHQANVKVTGLQIDMFIYQSHNSRNEVYTNVASLFGHMERWALTDETCTRTAATIVNYLRRTVGDDHLAAIGAGLDDIQELYEKKFTDADATFVNRVARENAGRFGVPELTNAGIAADVNYKPAGYGSVAGYLEISQATEGEIDGGLVRRARAFKSAAARFHKAFETLFGRDHPALNPKFAPSAFRKTGTQQQDLQFNSFINLLQNIVDNNKLTIRVNDIDLDDVQPLDDENVELAEWATIINRIVGNGNYPPSQSVRDAFKPVFVDENNEVQAPPQFVSDYANSTFAKKYADGQRKRRSARAISDDQDGNAEDGRGTWKDFVAKEFTKGEPVQKARLLNRVVAAVADSTSVPAEVNDKLLQAWRGPVDAGEDEILRPALNAGVGQNTSLVASLSSISSLPTVRRGQKNEPQFTLVSPLNDGFQLDTDDALAAGDGSGVNNNILRTMFAGVRIGAPENEKSAGQRTRPAQVPAGVRAAYAGGAPASFAQAEFTDIAGDEITINNNIVARYEMMGNKAHWLTRVAGQMFLLAPITRQTLHSFRENDIAQPVAFLLQQPFRRYRTTSMIFLSKPSDRDIGNVLIMDPDAHFGRNAIRKDIMLNASMYLGVTVSDCQNWFVAHDTAVVGYEGGETTTMFPLHQWDLNKLALLPINGPSIISMMVPSGCLVDKQSPIKVPLTHDIRGYRDGAFYQANSVHRASQFANQPMHPSAPFYTTLLKLNKLSVSTADDWHNYQRPRGTFNTTTHQGLQFIVNPHTGQPDRVVMSQDQFRDAVYPGCADLRLSFLARHYKPMRYEDIAVAI